MMEFDVYRRKSNPSERMAVSAGAGLPEHVRKGGMHGGAEDWELLKVPSEISDEAADDIAARGFCYFKLFP